MFKKSALCILLVLLLLLFVGCSASKVAGDAYMGDGFGESAGNANESISDAVSKTEGDKADSARKIIENIDLSVQTKAFDQLMSDIEAQVAELGGYVESSRISGREFDSDENRHATLTLRIPADKSGEFSAYVSENSVVVNRAVTTKDVTLQYVDIESRVAALETEKAALEKLMENADTMSEVLSVQQRLTEVIYEIESYKSQLRTYDNLVNYSTVTMNIREVERTTVVKKQNTWEKIGTNLVNGFANVWKATVGFFVFLVSAIPYLLPFAIIAGGTLLWIFRKRRKNKNK